MSNEEMTIPELLKAIAGTAKAFYPYLEFLIMCAALLYAGYLNGYHGKAVEVNEKANDWINTHCENLSRACSVPGRQVNFSLDFNNYDEIQANTDKFGIG